MLYLWPGVFDSARILCRSRGLTKPLFECCALVLWRAGKLRGAVHPTVAGSAWGSSSLSAAEAIPDLLDRVGDVSEWTFPVTVDLSLYTHCAARVCIFIENPLGMLRCRPFMKPLAGALQVVDYCTYGFLWQKSTCIWAWGPEGFNWEAHPRCKYDCHSCLSNGGRHAATIGRGRSVSLP